MSSQSPVPVKKMMTKTNRKKISEEQPLSGPTHFGHFIIMLLMKICRKILFVDINTKLFIYFGLVVALSIIGSVFTIPKSYFSQKRTILNDYFLKLGWGWTLFCVGNYILWTSLVYSCRNMAKMCQHGMRLVVGTVWWYFCTTTFRKIEAKSGTCADSQFGDPKTCLKAGQSWQGFDTSGHVFLQIMCSLIILEELKTFKYWQRLGTLLEDENLKNKGFVTEVEIVQSRKDFKEFTPYIKISVVLVTIISVLFDVMLISSTIYPFHSFSEVLFGFFIGVTTWFISYRILFRSGSPFPFIPCPIGESRLSFMN